jgi:hypothetical protein
LPRGWVQASASELELALELALVWASALALVWASQLALVSETMKVSV